MFKFGLNKRWGRKKCVFSSDKSYVSNNVGLYLQQFGRNYKCKVLPAAISRTEQYSLPTLAPTSWASCFGSRDFCSNNFDSRIDSA